jgi:hypothetical protein
MQFALAIYRLPAAKLRHLRLQPASCTHFGIP